MMMVMSASGQLRHSNVTWELVEAIRQVEACPRKQHIGKCCTGDYGTSRGQWQFKAIAWKDVNITRARYKLLQHSYTDVWKEHVSRAYAHDYLEILRGRFLGRKGREPMICELWCVWNLGFEDYFVKYEGDITKCPRSTIKNAMILEGIVKREINNR
jgi:hypothetical protein